MKIQMLYYFITLAESSSINEASKKLSIAQPSLTKSLQLLEQELNTKLFIRDTSGIHLTKIGEEILPEAKEVVRYYEKWLDLPNRQSSLQTIDIYMQSSFTNCVIPDITLKYKKKYPDIQICSHLCPDPERYISRDIEHPVLVLCVCGPANPYKDYRKMQGNLPSVLLHGNYCCLVNDKSAMSCNKIIHPEDLKGYYLVMTSAPDHPATSLKPLMKKIQTATTYSHIIQSDSINGVLNLVLSDPMVFTVSYYPLLKRYREVSDHRLTCIPFYEEESRGDLCLFYSVTACKAHPVLHEVVNSIRKGFEAFLQ